MTISVWRYSHLALAVSSFLFIALAALTGIILAFEPILQKTQPYRAEQVNQLTLAQTLPVLKQKYPDISELSIDAHQFVQVKASDEAGKNLEAYVDPQTGAILGKPTPQSAFFQWVTALHRSLFLHEAGRFMIGLTAFLLLLITVSGTLLIVQRQRSLKRFFARIVRDHWAPYYHVILGRVLLIPLFVIALSGTYLSLARFEWLPVNTQSPRIDVDAIRSGPVLPPARMALFNQIRLVDVQRIEFPFSDDVEDYYTLTLNNRELTVNQLTGDILSERRYPATVLLANLSLDVHTGRTSIVWALILAFAAANCLFFIYSGFSITWKRRASRVRNRFSAAESQYIILIGSENGSTFQFGEWLYQQLIDQGRKVFLSELNNYALYPQAEHLVVMTATYGLGDAPTNAQRFLEQLTKQPQKQPVQYSVLGFGSTAYPDFCQYAFVVNQALAQQPWARPLLDIHTVNDRSPHDIRLWAEAWSQRTNVALATEPLGLIRPTLKTLTVTHTTSTPQPDGTFLIRFKADPVIGVTSGDLLAIYPANDHRERLYSVGVIADEIQLSVRLHPGGLGSGLLHALTPGQQLPARIVSNPHFHFPTQASAVVMIANGTGIAPFLGMINQNHRHVPIYLYGGFRERKSLALYQDFLEASQQCQQLTHYAVAYSREDNKQYVSNLVEQDADFMANILLDQGVLMLCGSLAMQKDVLSLLETICQTKLGKSVSHYQSHGQIRMDCY